MKPKVWSLSAVGQDRPGIVAAISKLLYDNDCNLSDSSMTILAGQFAVVLLFELGTESDEARLAQTLEQLSQQWHLQLKAGPIEEGECSVDLSGQQSYLVSVYGADQSGLTWRFATCIAEMGYNVSDLSTKKIEGGTPVYILLLEIEAQSQAKERDELNTALQALASELGCSATLKNIESSEL